MLLGDLGGCKEEELVAVVVEVGVREDDRTADVEAGVVEAALRFGKAEFLGVGVGCVEDVVAGLLVGFTVKMVAARFGLSVEDDGAVGLDSGEGAGLDLGLGDHVDVGRDGGGAGGVEVGHGRAVGDDLHLVEAVAVDGVSARVLTKACLLAVVGAGEVAGVGCAGDQVEELDGAAAFDVEVLDLLVGQCVRLLTGGGWRVVAGFTGHGDADIIRRDLQDDVAEVELIVDVNADTVFARGPEAGCGDQDVVRVGRHRDEDDAAVLIRDDGTLHLAGLVDERRLGARDERAGGIGDGAAEGGLASLGVGCGGERA